MVCLWCCTDDACQGFRDRVRAEMQPRHWEKLREIHAVAHDLADEHEHWNVGAAIDKVDAKDYEQHLMWNNDEPLNTLEELSDVLDLLNVLMKAGYFEEESEVEE